MNSGDTSKHTLSDMTGEPHSPEAGSYGGKSEAQKIEEQSPEEKAEETWKTFARKLRKQDWETAKMWKEEIDTLMNFAGLYSVILAAFNIELYKRLVPADPTPDTNTLALIHLISATNNLSLPSTLAASTSPRPSTAAVWINALMFSSLVLGLASAFVGLIIREWLNFFLSPHSAEGERSTYIHCLRWDRGVIKWHVPGILSALSILLQLALALFLSGLLLFLWTVESKVAAVTTSIVCALGLFWLFTTMAPAFSNWCPYKSPQALAFVWFLHWVQSCIEVFLGHAQDWDNLASFHISASREDSSVMTTLRKFDGDWGSIERYTFNAMLDGDHELRKTLRWIRDNVFALGHKLLMDDILFSDFLQHCLRSTMADPVLDDRSSRKGEMDTQYPKSPGPLPDENSKEYEEYAVQVQVERSSSILPRLCAIVRHGDPLSHAARSDIATSAAHALAILLPELNATPEFTTEDHIQYLAPHICAGNPSCMVAVFDYFGQKAKLQVSKAEQTMEMFVDGLLHYACPSRIWAHEQLVFNDEMLGRDYATAVIAFIYNEILFKTIAPPRRISPAKDRRRYDASCLAMLLAMSIGPSECASMFPTLLGSLRYYTDRDQVNHKLVDASVINWLNRGYKVVRVDNAAAPPR